MIDPISKITSRTTTLPQENIDTDQIIPARFLTTTSRQGLGAAAFHDWRYDAEGILKSDSPFNEAERADHQILVAGANFGCGSSREHAPWALLDFEFHAIISTKIADIFKANSLKNGLVPVEVDEATHRYLLDNPNIEVTVDVVNMRVTTPNLAIDAPFELEAFARRCLLDGVDPLGHLLNQLPAIEAYEQKSITGV